MANVVVNDASLQDVANAIREKNGLDTKYKPAEMGQAIRDIPSGGGDVPPEALVLTGNCRFRFYNGGWDWFVEYYGDRITTKDIFGGYIFQASNLKEIPFDLNLSSGADNLFSDARKLKKCPIIRGQIEGTSGLFSNCNNITDVSGLNSADFSYMQTRSSNIENVFANCYSIRYIPKELISNIYCIGNSTRAQYMFNNCYCLEKIEGLVLNKWDIAFDAGSLTNQIISRNYRLDTFKFNLIENQPMTLKWKSALIDLSDYIGYCYNFNYIKDITNYNSGITADKEVTDAESYEALKNDPDWFTAKIEYSRYNHDSAVETINSLPDCAAAGGTNTVKFKGQSGELTDGGAINTLTEEEIAVAAAKGWTVSLV